MLCAVACFHTRPDTQHGHSTVILKFYFTSGCVLDDSQSIKKKNTGIKDMRKENGRKA